MLARFLCPRGRGSTLSGGGEFALSKSSRGFVWGGGVGWDGQAWN